MTFLWILSTPPHANAYVSCGLSLQGSRLRPDYMPPQPYSPVRSTLDWLEPCCITTLTWLRDTSGSASSPSLPEKCLSHKEPQFWSPQKLVTDLASRMEKEWMLHSKHVHGILSRFEPGWSDGPSSLARCPWHNVLALLGHTHYILRLTDPGYRFQPSRLGRGISEKAKKLFLFRFCLSKIISAYRRTRQR